MNFFLKKLILCTREKETRSHKQRKQIEIFLVQFPQHRILGRHLTRNMIKPLFRIENYIVKNFISHHLLGA